MKFLDFLTLTKDITYQTSLSPQEVKQRLESKISPKPKRKSIFDRPPLTYRGEITEKAFEIGSRARGKETPPTAYGIIEEEQGGSLIEVKIIPDSHVKISAVLFFTLIILASGTAIHSKLNGLDANIFLPVALSFVLAIIYSSQKSRNTKLAKYIQQNIDGKITK